MRFKFNVRYLSVGADTKPRVHVTGFTETDPGEKYLGVFVMNPTEYAAFKRIHGESAFTVKHAGD